MCLRFELENIVGPKTELVVFLQLRHVFSLKISQFSIFETF